MSNWLIPYIAFQGNCEQAVTFYEKVLGGESQILRFGDAPPNPEFPVPEEAKNLVLHAELRKDGHIIRFSDTFPGYPLTMGNNISFSLEFDTVEEVRSIFASLSQDGAIEMEPHQTFFTPLYCKFTDKFGVAWQISCKKG